MTLTDFAKAYGADFRKFANKPAFKALLEVIDAESPARKMPEIDANVFNGAQMHLGEVMGWEKLRKLLTNLTTTPEREFEPKEKYSEEEDI